MILSKQSKPRSGRAHRLLTEITNNSDHRHIDLSDNNGKLPYSAGLPLDIGRLAGLDVLTVTCRQLPYPMMAYSVRGVELPESKKTLFDVMAR